MTLTTMSKQRHDLGYRKRLLSTPIREAAIRRRQEQKAQRKAPSVWYEFWLRYNWYPTWDEFYAMERGHIPDRYRKRMKIKVEDGERG